MSNKTTEINKKFNRFCKRADSLPKSKRINRLGQLLNQVSPDDSPPVNQWVKKAAKRGQKAVAKHCYQWCNQHDVVVNVSMKKLKQVLENDKHEQFALLFIYSDAVFDADGNDGTLYSKKRGLHKTINKTLERLLTNCSLSDTLYYPVLLYQSGDCLYTLDDESFAFRLRNAICNDCFYTLRRMVRAMGQTIPEAENKTPILNTSIVQQAINPFLPFVGIDKRKRFIDDASSNTLTPLRWVAGQWPKSGEDKRTNHSVSASVRTSIQALNDDGRDWTIKDIYHTNIDTLQNVKGIGPARAHTLSDRARKIVGSCILIDEALARTVSIPRVYYQVCSIVLGDSPRRKKQYQKAKAKKSAAQI